LDFIITYDFVSIFIVDRVGSIRARLWTKFKPYVPTVKVLVKISLRRVLKPKYVRH